MDDGLPAPVGALNLAGLDAEDARHTGPANVNIQDSNTRGRRRRWRRKRVGGLRGRTQMIVRKRWGGSSTERQLSAHGRFADAAFPGHHENDALYGSQADAKGLLQWVDGLLFAQTKCLARTPLAARPTSDLRWVRRAGGNLSGARGRFSMDSNEV